MGNKSQPGIKKTNAISQDTVGSLRTEIKNLHKQLDEFKNRDQLYTHIQKKLHIGSFQWNYETNRLTWNTDETSHGKMEALLKKQVHPLDYHSVLEHFKEMQKTGTPAPTTFRTLDKDKKIKHFNLEAEVMLDNSTPVGILGFFYDVTQSIEAKTDIEEQFKLFMKFTPGAAFIKTDQNILVYCNKFFASLLQKTPEELIGQDIAPLVPAESEKDFLVENEHVIKHRTVIEHEHTYPGPDGPTYWQTIKFPIVKTDHTVLIGSISFDITANKFNEQQAHEHESRLQSIFRASPVGIGVISNRQLIQVNNLFCEMTGYTRRELVNKNASMLYPSREEYDRVGKDKYDQIKELGTGTVETVWQRKDGSLIDVLLSTTPLNMQDLSEGLTFTALDITERKRTEQELSASQIQLSTLFHNLPGMAYRCKNDKFWTMEFISSGCEKLTGYQPKDFVNNKTKAYIEIIFPDDRENVNNVVQAAINNKTYFELEYRIITANNGIKSVLERGTGITDKDGKLLFLEGFVSDITARKQAELLLKNELEEKKVLLKEIHHRVKNNLQIIISLLNMQSNQYDDPSIVDAFKECTSRVYSMALVHEKMYRTSHFSKINFKDFIGSIVKEILFSFQTNANISYELELDEIFLELNKAIPCSLILNELINNAFKHAFPNKKSGKLIIESKLNESKHCMITISDNGIGVPNAIRPETSESMGFTLVRVLASQIEGSIDMKSSKRGTKFILTFPL